jgi:rSAM/selenodomain-associated transferase 1
LLPLVIVFAKAPRPGFVKTRLGLEPTAAASLYAEFVSRTLETVFKFRDEADLELSLDIPYPAWTEFSILRTVQNDGDLGVKLYAALERGLSTGHPKVLILGSDSPTLPVEHIRFLLDCVADVALGPTLDGGYYGIACRKINPTMFDGVRWSSVNTLRDTISSAVACGLCCTIGPDWFDVDRPEDLLRLRNNASEGGDSLTTGRSGFRYCVTD